ncbi:MAG: hypothetical protein OXU75_08495 [Deltaproteobacteria bacterium]|nr:hypothetical protein [Deltaproteobacteria bacterium]
MRIIVLLLVLGMFGCSSGDRIGTGEFTSFRDGVLSLYFEDTERKPPRLDTRRDVESTAPYPTEIPGHYGRSWTLLKASSEDTFMGYVIVSWHDENPLDYLALGWWVHFPGQRYPDLNIWQDDVFTHIFLDGPELNPEKQPKFPVKGAASYHGTAGGTFDYFYGENWGDAKGKDSHDEYEAAVTLTADFGEGTIGGCIGCEGDIVIKSQHLQSLIDTIETGATIERRVDPKDYEVHFAPTKFNHHGVFESEEGVSVTHPERIGQTTYYGSWAGNISNRNDSAGNPRLVAGGNIVVFTEEDGSFGRFAGLFSALSEDFRK